MKKLLLLASTVAMGVVPMFGQVQPSHDPATYAPADGYTMTNRWIISQMTVGPDAMNVAPFSSNNARTATILNGEVYVAETNADLNGVLHRFDFASGASKGSLNLTINGEPLNGTLCANNVGVDDYGHLYVCGFRADLNKGSLQVYLVNPENGELTALPEISPLDAGESASAAAVRVDYIDVIGDLTGTECSGTVMAASNTDNLAVLRAVREQGTDEFVGGFDGFFFWDATAITETCPMITDTDAGKVSPQASWGTAPMVKMINDEEHLGESFYVDGFTTAPAIYNTQGTLTDSFNSCISLPPGVGTNGIAEFSLGDDNFAVWSVCQYDKTPGCTASVGTFGQGFDFADLKVLYTFPEAGLGNQSDGGTRAHCLMTKKYVDENNKEAVYILDYKCRNGLGVYVFAQEGFVDPNPSQGGVDGIEDDVNAPAVYFNLQGQKIDNPAAGLYIVKRGDKVTKELVK